MTALARKVLLLTVVTLLWTSVPGRAQTVDDFQLPTVMAGDLRLSDFRGRVVLLDFLASWCRPCKDAIPHLNQLQRDYGAKGLSVIGYSVDNGGLHAMKPFVVRNGVEFPVVLGSMDQARRLAQVKVLPTTLVIDPQGRVVERFAGFVGEGRLLAAVKPYLGNGAPPAPATAEVKLRKASEKRFTSVHVSDNHELGGQRGVAVYVRADVADLSPEQGVWLELTLKAADGASKKLYQRVDDTTKNRHILFVACDQMPGPAEADHSAQITILGAGLKPVETSELVRFTRPCAVAAPAFRARRIVDPALPAPAPEAAKPQTPDLAVDNRANGARLKQIWVTQETSAGEAGLSVHVVADLQGFNPPSPLYFQVNLQPELRQGQGLTPAGPAKKLVLKVDDPSKPYYNLFATCGLLPRLSGPGAYRAWVAVLDSQQRQLEKSGEFVIPASCAGGSGTR